MHSGVGTNVSCRCWASRPNAYCSGSQARRLAKIVPQTAVRAPSRRAARDQNLAVQAGIWAPPTVSDTKAAFLEKYRKPVPGIYNTVLQELLVQQHVVRWNKNYQYDEVLALGFMSVFEQLADGLPDKDLVFSAYIGALGEVPEQYKEDAKALEEWARGLSGPDDVRPVSDGDYGQKVLAKIADRVSKGEFYYSKFFAIGLFRLLELTGAKDPKALGALVSSLGVRQEAVNRDLMTYKGVLSKLSAAKELYREYLERERKKAAEREAEKAAKAAAVEAEAAKPAEVPAGAVAEKGE